MVGFLILPRVCTRLRKESFDLLEVTVLDEPPPGFGASDMKMEHGESHLRSCLGEFTPNQKDMVRLTMMPLFRKATL